MSHPAQVGPGLGLHWGSALLRVGRPQGGAPLLQQDCVFRLSHSMEKPTWGCYVSDWPGLAHMPTPDQSLGPGGMTCSDWPVLDHVSILGLMGWGLPAQSTWTKRGGRFHKGKSGCWCCTREPEGRQRCQPCWGSPTLWKPSRGSSRPTGIHYTESGLRDKDLRPPRTFQNFPEPHPPSK